MSYLVVHRDSTSGQCNASIMSCASLVGTKSIKVLVHLSDLWPASTSATGRGGRAGRAQTSHAEGREMEMIPAESN